MRAVCTLFQVCASGRRVRHLLNKGTDPQMIVHFRRLVAPPPASKRPLRLPTKTEQAQGDG